MSKGIFFQEISNDTADFLHELTDPDLVRPQSIPTEVSTRLREAQIRKLEGNIETLREKQAQFNRKMDDYVENLRRLIGSLERSNRDAGADDGETRSDASSSTSGDRCGRAHRASGGILVQCHSCDDEREFENLRILFARESDDSIHQPTECYVADEGSIKKGVFFCGSCGGEMLTIRTR